MRKTLGEDRHQHNLTVDGKRGAGFVMPDADTLGRLVDAALGIPEELDELALAAAPASLERNY
jgi:hypothetical protein